MNVSAISVRFMNTPAIYIVCYHLGISDVGLLVEDGHVTARFWRYIGAL